MSARNVYAIRISNAIEFRASRAPLKKLVSKLTRKIKKIVKEWHFDDRDWRKDRTIDKEVIQTVVYEQTTYLGGTVVGYTKLDIFFKLFHKRLLPDGLLKLTPVQGSSVLDPKWRKKWL